MCAQTSQFITEVITVLSLQVNTLKKNQQQILPCNQMFKADSQQFNYFYNQKLCLKRSVCSLDCQAGSFNSGNLMKKRKYSLSSIKKSEFATTETCQCISLQADLFSKSVSPTQVTSFQQHSTSATFCLPFTFFFWHRFPLSSSCVTE